MRQLGESLERWIRRLIYEDKLYQFYKSKEWQTLRQQILEENHYECEDCRARGIYERAYCVHHEREIKEYPELALSRTYRDKDGVHKQLWALCFQCHEKRHERAFTSGERKKSELEQRVLERW